MASIETSPTNRTYLVSVSAPQTVVQAAGNLMDVLKRSGLITSPLPPIIPILESSDMPPVPVPGLLPVCTEPLILGKHLSLDTAGTQDGWVVWPVDSSGWFDSLAETLAPVGVSDRESESLIYPLSGGIPLARDSNGTSPEVNYRIENVPGWRALNLVCWSIEYLTERPWYLSAAWYPLWRRRLKRAPKPTNNNK